MKEKKQIKIAYMIEEYEITSKDGKQIKRRKWTSVGYGYVNRDGSINMFMKAFPTNGQFQVRDKPDPRTYEKEKESYGPDDYEYENT